MCDSSVIQWGPSWTASPRSCLHAFIGTWRWKTPCAISCAMDYRRHLRCMNESVWARGPSLDPARTTPPDSCHSTLPLLILQMRPPSRSRRACGPDCTHCRTPTPSLLPGAGALSLKPLSHLTLFNVTVVGGAGLTPPVSPRPPQVAAPDSCVQHAVVWNGGSHHMGVGRTLPLLAHLHPHCPRCPRVRAPTQGYSDFRFGGGVTGVPPPPLKALP